MSIGFYAIWLKLFLNSINSDTISNDVFIPKFKTLWKVYDYDLLTSSKF